MNARRLLLATDSFINLVLGALLVFFPKSIAIALGIPIPATAFYASILGGVLFGIGIALAIEVRKPRERLTGLGLGGAIAINLSGGLVLVYWLIWGILDAPTRGYVFMWFLALSLVGISIAEWIIGAQSCGHIPFGLGDITSQAKDRK